MSIPPALRRVVADGAERAVRAVGKSAVDAASSGAAKAPGSFWKNRRGNLLQRAGQNIAAQFRGSSWRKAGRTAKELVTKPGPLLRSGVRQSFKGLAPAAMAIAYPAYEIKNMVSGARGPSGQKKEMLNQEFGQGASQIYGDARRAHDAALYGQTGERAGAMVGGEVAALAAFARKVRFLPAMALMTGGAMLGGAAGKGVDRLRGQPPQTPEQRDAAIQGYRNIQQVVEARKRQMYMQQRMQSQQPG